MIICQRQYRETSKMPGKIAPANKSIAQYIYQVIEEKIESIN